MAKLSDAQIAAVAKQAGFSGNNLVTAVAVALAESGGEYDIDNRGLNKDGSVDYGLWQINSVHADLLRKYDWRSPQQNATMAKIIHSRQGWNGWSSYKNRSYGRFQGRAMVAAAAPATGAAITQARWWIPNYPDWAPGPNEIPDPSDLLPDNIPGPIDAYQDIAAAVNAIQNAIAQILEFFGTLGKGLNWLGDVENWKRLGMFVAGLALMALAIWRWSPGGELIRAGTKTATNVAVSVAGTKGLGKVKAA